MSIQNIDDSNVTDSPEQQDSCVHRASVTKHFSGIESDFGV